MEEPEYKNFYDIGNYLRDAVDGKKNIQGEYIVYAGYNANVLFYVKLLQEKGIQIKFKDRNKLDLGNTVILSQPFMKSFVAKNYSYKLLKRDGSIDTYIIIGKNRKT
ncbi:MAG: hypothetical protein PHT07_00340 [Paludibacter sp.]|nr:hypothetical protein [Paludibacter sp.]